MADKLSKYLSTMEHLEAQDARCFPQQLVETETETVG